MKGVLQYWSLWERVWLFAFCGVAVGITLATGDNLFGFSVFLAGVLCVVLAAKGNIFTYAVGMYNTVGYAWMAWQNGLFGEVGLNLLFFLPMNIAGFFLWKKHLKSGTVQMRRMGPKGIALTAVSAALGTGMAGMGLSLLTAQNTPYIDAATNVLSVIATILMVRRFREQWLCYIALNMLSVAMWSLRALAGSPEGPLMAVMWGAYLVNAFYGWYIWSGGVKKEAAT